MNSIGQDFIKYFDRRVEECGCKLPPEDDGFEGANTQVRGSEANLVATTIYRANEAGDEMPGWNAALGSKRESGFSLAGGAVFLSRQIAITAYHLVKNVISNIPDNVCLHVGDHDLERGDKIKVLKPLTSELLTRFDIVLLLIAEAPKSDAKWQSISIIESAEFAAKQETKDYCLATGWGYTHPTESGSSKILMDIAMRLGPFYAVPKFPIPTLFRVESCNGGGPCEKDSGSGLFVIGSNGEPLLAGIQSRIASGRNSCHTRRYPALFSNVSALRDEIENVAGLYL